MDKLHEHEIQQIRQHEGVHVRQMHTLDLLLLELTAILFWFNPLIRYLKQQLQDVHEYLADEAVAGKGDQQKDYAHLLLKLATSTKTFPLSTSFSNTQINNRIMMLMKTRTLARQKFFFLLLLPLIASLLFLLSCIDENQGDFNIAKNEETTSANEAASDGSAQETNFKVGQINWTGNTVYDDEKLSKILGLKQGDAYSEEILNSRLNFNPELDDVSSLYMDHGYLFFNVEVEEKESGSGTVDLTMNVFEGEKIKTGDIIIKGSKTVSREEVVQQVSMKPGDWFSRAALIASQKAIAEMGYFDPKEIHINPLPDHEKGTVDIEFTVTEIKAEN